MKFFKLLFPTFIITLLVADHSFAQYKKGDFLLNLGIGAGTYAETIPLNVSFEYGFGKFISAGVQTDVYTYRHGRDQQLRTVFPTSLRATYHYGKHFLKQKNLDLYAGAAVGVYGNEWWDYRQNRNPRYLYGEHGGLSVGLYAGVKYLFTPKFGLFAELGQNISWLKAGMAFRFY